MQSFHRPSSIDSLLRVDGVSERQCERFGQQLVNCVATFCKESKLEADNFDDHTDSASSTVSQVVFSPWRSVVAVLSL